MTRPTNYQRAETHSFQWIGGACFFLGVIWVVLLVRDYFTTIVAPEATGGEYHFFSPANMTCAAVAILLAITGSIMFFMRTDARKNRHKHRSHRRASVAMATPRTRMVPSVDTDTDICLEANIDTPVCGTAALQMAEIPAKRVRVKHRVRVRVPRKG